MSRIPVSAKRTALGVIALGLAVLSVTPATAQQASALDGIWRISSPVTAISNADGGALPFKPAAAKIYLQNKAKRQKGDLSYDSASWCASVGMPRAMLINYPFQLVVRQPYVAFLHEWNWWARTAYFDGALADGTKGGRDAPQSETTLYLGGSDPNGPMGQSRAHWEGDTLVIATTNLIDSTLLDNSGVPHSGALKITERLRLRGPDVLENRIRIDDPVTFTRPWKTVVTFNRQTQPIREDVCLDRIRNGAPAVKD